MGNPKGLLAILATVILFSTTTLKAQDQAPGTGGKENFRYWFTQANLMMGEQFNDSALRIFTSLYKQDTSNCNIAYDIGQLYLTTQAHKANALPYLEKAARHVVSKYHPDDPYEKNAPPPTYYFLARAQHLNYQFDAAIANFTKFKSLLNKGDARDKDIDYWIQCCNDAIALMKTPVDCKIMNVGDSINSQYPDYSPIITADEQELLFTSRRPVGDPSKDINDINGNYFEDIWISYAKPDGSWTKARDLDNNVNTAGNDATVSISPDGQELLLYQDNTEGDGNILISYSRGPRWSYPVLIDTANAGVVNSPSWEPSAAYSPDHKTLYFVSNRAGGKGGSDIYKVNISDSGKWGAPINLGDAINTEYDEDAPFLHPDDSTMFFSSKGHNTMGGFDVFTARKNAQGEWANVKNMGYPINTPDDDIYFNVSADGRRAFYTSVRKGGYGEKDIYEVSFVKSLPVDPVAILVGYIKTADGSKLPSDVLITSADGKSTIKSKVQPTTGKFLQILHPNTNYNVKISTGGKDVFNQSFFLPTDSSYTVLSRAFFRTTIVLGDTTNVFAGKKNTTPVANNMTGRMMLNDTNTQPIGRMKLQLVNDKDSIIATTLTDDNGYFTFKNLMYDHSYILDVDAKDTKLKHMKDLYLADKKGNIVRNYDQQKKTNYIYHNLPTDLTSLNALAMKDASMKQKQEQYSKDTAKMPHSDADFTRYFAYNIDKINKEDADFKSFIDKVASKVSSGSVSLSIKGSASKVPTSLFHTNKNLAHRRAKDAKDAITEALKERKIDVSTIKINIDFSVAGPDYAHDASNQVKYEKFQNVMVYIQ
ncbi:MAG TPA: hypothetical protein VK806_14165 [Bacteroidia bacterium]|nr:hypothetical protein [Bacteroidia bacterium]